MTFSKTLRPFPANPKVTSGSPGALFLEALLRIADVGAVQHGFVVDHVEAVGRGVVNLAVQFFGAGLHEHGAGVDADRLGLAVGRRFVAVGVELSLCVLRRADRLAAGAEHLFVLGVQQIPGAVDAAVELRGGAAGVERGVARADDRRAFGGAQHGFVLEQPRGDAARFGAPGDGAGERAHLLAVGADDVGLPVVEVQLGGLTDLFLGAARVADVGQRDVDFVGAGALDFRFGDPELIDALAHDVDRAFERFGGDLGVCGGAAHVDERDAALEFEPQARGLERDHDHRRGQQAGDDQQDQEVAAATPIGVRDSPVRSSARRGAAGLDGEEFWRPDHY